MTTCENDIAASTPAPPLPLLLTGNEEEKGGAAPTVAIESVALYSGPAVEGNDDDAGMTIAAAAAEVQYTEGASRGGAGGPGGALTLRGALQGPRPCSAFLHAAARRKYARPGDRHADEESGRCHVRDVPLRVGVSLLVLLLLISGPQ